MNKKFIYYFLLILAVSALPKTTKIITTHFSPKEIPVSCSDDTFTCPDDTSVARVPPTCEFAACVTPITSTPPDIIPEASTSTEVSTTSVAIATSSPIVTKTQNTKNFISVATIPPAQTTSIVSKLTAVVATVVNAVTSPFKGEPAPSGNPNDAFIPASTYIPTPITQSGEPAPVSLPPADFAGQKYLVKENNILSNDNKVIYTIPPEVTAAVSSSNVGWTNTTINVVPVGTVAPIPPGNAIPITNLPGKYYLSENSFGNMEACEFSNKIFILDTNTNEVTLMYEENSSTLSHDDPRACNSEIFLLATEGSELILKYHTIGTNTLCDSAWSEPDKTFFLDVTKLQTQGMKSYIIPTNLSATAEQEEEACRAKL